jgi:hypothetical protein
VSLPGGFLNVFGSPELEEERNDDNVEEIAL